MSESARVVECIELYVYLTASPRRSGVDPLEDLFVKLLAQRSGTAEPNPKNTLKMSGHHHHHGHGGHCCGHGEDGHDHSNDITPAIQSLLYSQIQFDSILTLNGRPEPMIDPSCRFVGSTADRRQNLFRNQELLLFRKHGPRD